MAFFFFCGCVWQISVFIVEESEKMNSKHRKRVPTSVFSPSRTIILLDINMPEMGGLELCQLIREHISCPIIFLTARVTEEDIIKGLVVGGDDYITTVGNFSMGSQYDCS